MSEQIQQPSELSRVSLRSRKRLPVTKGKTTELENNCSNFFLPRKSITDFTKKIREYIDTPFLYGGRLKGIGIDCAGLIICACKELGIEIKDNPRYSKHHDLEMLLTYLELNLIKTDYKIPIPGSVIVIVQGRKVRHHLGYWTEDNTFIHAWLTTGVSKVVETPILPEWMYNIHSVWKIRGVE